MRLRLSLHDCILADPGQRRIKVRQLLLAPFLQNEAPPPSPDMSGIPLLKSLISEEKVHT